MPIRAIAATDAQYSFLDNYCSSAGNCCSSVVGLAVAQQRALRQPSYPPAGEKGMTVDRSSNRLGAAEALRPATLVSGIIGGIAVGPTEVAWPNPAATAGAPLPKPVEASTLAPEPTAPD
jgi:hypothetical protein